MSEYDTSKLRNWYLGSFSILYAAAKMGGRCVMIAANGVASNNAMLHSFMSFCNLKSDDNIKRGKSEIVFRDSGGIIMFIDGLNPDILRGDSLDLVMLHGIGPDSDRYDELKDVVIPSVMDKRGRVLFASDYDSVS